RSQGHFSLSLLLSTCDLRLTTKLRPGNLVQEQVNNNSRHRHIQPQRKRPSRNGPVPRILPLQSSRQRHEYQGHDRSSQNRMRQQDREIHRSNPSLSTEMFRSVNESVLGEIVDQENR